MTTVALSRQIGARKRVIATVQRSLDVLDDKASDALQRRIATRELARALAILAEQRRRPS